MASFGWTDSHTRFDKSLRGCAEFDGPSVDILLLREQHSFFSVCVTVAGAAAPSHLTRPLSLWLSMDRRSRVPLLYLQHVNVAALTHVFAPLRDDATEEEEAADAVELGCRSVELALRASDSSPNFVELEHRLAALPTDWRRHIESFLPPTTPLRHLRYPFVVRFALPLACLCAILLVILSVFFLQLMREDVSVAAHANLITSPYFYLPRRLPSEWAALPLEGPHGQRVYNASSVTFDIFAMMSGAVWLLRFLLRQWVLRRDADAVCAEMQLPVSVGDPPRRGMVFTSDAARVRRHLYWRRPGTVEALVMLLVYMLNMTAFFITGMLAFVTDDLSVMANCPSLPEAFRIARSVEAAPDGAWAVSLCDTQTLWSDLTIDNTTHAQIWPCASGVPELHCNMYRVLLQLCGGALCIFGVLLLAWVVLDAFRKRAQSCAAHTLRHCVWWLTHGGVTHG